MASAGAFTFWVLMGMTHVPAHARSVLVAERILGSSYARIELAPSSVVVEDDDRELFVAAGCVHPSLVPDMKIITAT